MAKVRLHRRLQSIVSEAELRELRYIGCNTEGGARAGRLDWVCHAGA